MIPWMLGLLLVTAEPATMELPAPNSQLSVVVVCPERLDSGLTSWITARSDAHWTVDIVRPQLTAQETLVAIQQANAKTGYVVLVGDCQLPTIAPVDVSRQTPTFYLKTPVAARFGSPDDAATDLPYGDLDGDGIPEAVVGRLPADNADELKRLLDRSLAAEANQDFGIWRRQVHLVAGVGNFGFFADAAIEAATSGLIQTLLPGGVQTSVLYASERSPFFPGFDSFRSQATNRFCDGGLAWVYVGHGRVTELDRVPSGPSGIPILSTADIDRLKPNSSSPPLAVMLACYTGAFDARSDCIAERMVMTDGGPVAAIAGTRVTMPYGNASLAAAMMDAWFLEQVPRLGDIVAIARQRLLAENDPRRPKLLDTLASVLSPNSEELAQERLEHASLYNLLGDPTMTLRHANTLSIDGPRRGEPGEQVEVSISGGKTGTMIVELCLPLGQVTQNKSVAKLGDATEDRTVLDRCEVEVTGDSQIVKLNIPQGISGECIIRGFCSSKDSCGIGAMQIRVIPKKE